MHQSAQRSDSPSRTIARGQLAEYDRILADHAEAEDCGRCETYMELGVQVFQWILRADQDYRRELYANPKVHSEAVEKELETLARGWLAHGKGLIAWAERNAARGFQVKHLEDFRRSFEEATAIVESLDDTDASHQMTEPLILLRDQALLEHRNGETSEFV
jgi:hypothetical protein